MNRGIVVIVFAIIANLVLAVALVNSSWNPIVVAALVFSVFAIVATCYFFHQNVIDAAGHGWNWCCTNRNKIAKTALVVVLVASTLVVLWLLAVKAVESRPTVTTPVVAPAPVVTSVTTASPATVSATPQIQTVVAGPEWGEWVTTPLPGRIGFASEKNLVQYEARNQDGFVIPFPAPNDEHRTFPGQLSAVQFRSLENEPVRIRVRVTQQ